MAKKLFTDTEYVSNAIQSHDTNVDSHKDIRKLIQDIDVATQEELNKKSTTTYVDAQDKKIDDKVNVLSTNKSDITYVDAQDKKMDDKITVLRGETLKQYANTITTISQIKDNGTYRVLANDGTFPFMYGDVFKTLGEGGEYTLFGTDTVTGITYTNKFKVGSGLKGWKQIATTEKIDTLFTPYTGYEISFNKSYKINNIMYINFEVSKIDGTSFVSNSDVVVAVSPVVLGIDLPLNCIQVNTGVEYITSSSICFCSSRNILIKTTSASVKKIIVSGVVVL